MRVLTTPLRKILSWICIVLFAALVLIVVWQVFARQVLHNPSAWTEEASRMVFVWLGLFAAALVFAERGHIAVDFAARLMSKGAQKVIAMAVQVVIIVFALWLLVYGGIVAGQGAWNQHLAALSFLTLGQMYLVMPISGVLIALFALENLIEIATGKEPPFPASEEEELIENLETDGALAAAAESGGATSATRHENTDRNEKRG